MKRLAASNRFWLILSLVLFVISGLGSAIVQTSGGSVAQKTLTWETPSGKTQSAFLFIPEDASAEDRRPAVVLSHGYNNQKQMQDNNYVELAKRGYVVLSVDRYSQGSSTVNRRDEVDTTATGTYEGVQLLATLPYVDTSKIGVSGHSAGCGASTQAVMLDNEADTQLIAAFYGVDCDPAYRDEDGTYTNIYGARDAGILAAKYDEFFFRDYDADGNVLSAPRDYIHGENAQSFLNFGTESAGEERDAYTSYIKNIDGEEAIRRIDNPGETHPWATFSTSEAHDLVSFYDEAFGAPNPVDPSSQTWPVKAFFNGLGLVALAMFLVAFSKALLVAPIFASLRVTKPATVAPLSGGRKGRFWFWGALLVSAVFSGVSYIMFASSDWGSTFASGSSINPQGPTSFIGAWAALNGLFALVVMFVSYYAFGKKNGQNLREVGVFPGWRKFWLGILLAVVVLLAAMVILFASDYFFQSDWRLYVVAITTFGADRIWMIFLYLPLYLLFYVFNSIAINSFNRFTVRGREWVNTAFLSIMTALPSIVVLLIQYVTFGVTGELAFRTGSMAMAGIWLQFVVPYLLVTVIITRKIFRATNNPYIGGVIMASIATVGSVSTSYTMYG